MATATGRLEQDALSTLLSVDDHALSHDDDVPSPRVTSAAAAGVHSKLRPWAARTAEATATAKIRASNSTQMNKQPEVALIELAMVGPGKRGKQGDKKPRAISRTNVDVAAVREAPPLPLLRVAVAAETAGPVAGEESDDSQLESSDQENDRRSGGGLFAPFEGNSASAAKKELAARGGITVDKLHRLRREASSSPGHVTDKILFGTAAAGLTLPDMIKTVTRSETQGGGDSDDDGMNNLKHMMQRAEIGILPLAARSSADALPDSVSMSAGFGVKVLPLTTHSLQVGFGSAITAHRLVPLPDRSTGGTVQQGCGAI